MHTIFDIQRGSYVDGPGIRTVVFFKGCNLDCAWCHNPESKSAAAQLLFYQSRCIGCGRCRKVCKSDAVREDFTVDAEKCTLCGKCTIVCHPDAKSICGEPADADKIMAKIKKDAPYFEGSGGGVTFSGGECMLQPELLAELLKRCKAEGIHTAVDTAGNVPWERFDAILPYTDLFLYDFKHNDDEKHRAGTGVSNRRILANLEKLLEHCPERVIVRIPIIPGFNDDAESLAAIGRWLGAHNRPKFIEPLAYHKLGEHKAEALGKPAFIADAPSADAFLQMKQILFDAMEESK